MVNLPGHADGLSAVRNAESRFVRRFPDGGYGGKCREEMITSGIAADRQLQKRSPQRIGEQRPGPDCMGSLANRDPGIVPHVIGLRCAGCERKRDPRRHPGDPHGHRGERGHLLMAREKERGPGADGRPRLFASGTALTGGGVPQ